MDVKPSYKQTEVGVIPVDWEVTTVGAEFAIQLGKMLDVEKNQGETKPYLGNRAVQWGRFDLADIGLVKMSPSDLQRFRLRSGDLLVCEGGEIGRAAIWDSPLAECYYQKALHRLRPKNGYNVQLMLGILQRLAATGFLLNFVTQTSIAHLPKEKFETVPIPLPPSRAEQEAIAGALSDADALIESLEQLVAKKRQIKHGAMQELLTGRKRLPGFETCSGFWEPTGQTHIIDLGPLPKDWLIRPLVEVGRWYSGGTPSMKNPAYWSGDVPWVSPKDMKVPRLYDAIDHISGKAVADGTRVLPAGTVLMVIRGMILAHSFPVARAERPVAFNQDMKALVVHDDIDSNYVLYWLMGHAQKLRGLTTESTHGTKRLPPETLYQVPFRLPPTRAEQEAIAGTLSDMDSEIECLESRLSKARLVKQGMMQELLTGRIRLV